MSSIKKNLLRSLLLPLVLSILFSCASKFKVYAQKKNFILVLDAGHGGHDNGTSGFHEKEKNINLSVALLVGKKISQRFPKVKVIYTRKDDRYIELYQRARIANKNNADLFISIHTNGVKNRKAHGIETFTLGLWRTKENLNVAIRENQSILLEKDYQKNYSNFNPHSTESYIIFETLQNKHLEQSILAAQYVQGELRHIGTANRGVRQAGFLVLHQTAMPSILVELGFISNSRDIKILRSHQGQKKLSDAIVNGFSRYYKNFNQALGVKTIENSNYQEDDYVQSPIPPKEKTINYPQKQKTVYRIQILASKRKISKRDRQLKGEKVLIEKVGRYYCYSVFASTKLSTAKRKLKRYKRRFKGAFIVSYQNNQRKKIYYK